MNKLALSNSDRSKILVYAQVLFNHRQIANCLLNGDTTLSDEIKRAVLAYPEKAQSKVQKEVSGILKWAQKQKQERK